MSTPSGEYLLIYTARLPIHFGLEALTGPGVSMPSLQFLKKGRFFIDRLDRRQRIRIESRRYLHPSTPGRRFNTSFVRVFSGIDNDSPRSSFHRNSSLFASSIHFARARDLYWYTRVPPEVVFGATILWEVEGRFECDSLLKETVDVEVVRSRSCMTDAEKVEKVERKKERLQLLSISKCFFGKERWDTR